ncbi:MAG: hypothetical protein HQ567_01785 [Candidatus Nealsonbacteria bacterium]|nr:hypothetical protein [Candidatus Nealsonbacteria bacterium]
MSANKYAPHVLVLSEDNANVEITNGFKLHAALDARAIQVLPCAGGWAKVRDTFLSNHVIAMKRYAKRYMILLVDFDRDSARFDEMTKDIPKDLAERVFVIGVWSEPEELRRADLGSKEDVGGKLASECYDGTRDVWNHDLLSHNANELTRMTTLLRPILFPQT